jgi:hypothetical protein
MVQNHGSPELVGAVEAGDIAVRVLMRQKAHEEQQERRGSPELNR